MASEMKRAVRGTRVSVVVPEGAPALASAAAAELLALLRDAHRSLAAQQQPKRPEAA
jgi:hypothetical protein